jgi:ABC-type Fe3+/spermidine/putrescine transport system ATPase subunit
MIAIDRIEQRFGSFTLGPLSLAVEPGDYWVILGPSGAGKSLLLHTLAGLHTPEHGDIVLGGEVVTAAPPERRGVGLVFQQSALFPHLSVTDNIAYGLRARRVSAALRRQRVLEIVERVGIAALTERPTATLSGGEAQKVAIARALAIRPRVLLLDEPLGPIDHNARLALQDELKRIHAAFGLTTLHVTHSREEARLLGDHCAVMLGGRIVQRGATGDVFARPRCSFVARFLGADASVAGTPECTETCVGQGWCDAVGET